MGLTAIILVVVSLVIGVITIYLAIWSKYGIGEKLNKGFGDLRVSGIKVARDIDKRMNDLMEIIKMLIPQGETVEYGLKNIGTVKISVPDMGENMTDYIIETQQPIFKPRFLVEKANGSKEFKEKERTLFGEGRETKLRSAISNRLHAGLPSADKQICSEFMAFFLNWLDTEYFQSLKEFEESESAIGKYLKG